MQSKCHLQRTSANNFIFFYAFLKVSRYFADFFALKAQISRTFAAIGANEAHENI